MKIALPVFSSILLLTTSLALADSWNELNAPTNMSPNYQYRFDQLPTSGGLDNKNMPWSENYWESDWGGISLRWGTLTKEQLDPDGNVSLAVRSNYFTYTPPSKAELLAMSKGDIAKLSPAEKYDILMGRYDYPTVASERVRTNASMEDWQGLCHGWVPAAINHTEPGPTEATNADGIVIPFGTSDVKGLMSYYYGVTAYAYARGNRWVSHTKNSIQFLDHVDQFDTSPWVDLAPLAKLLMTDSRGNDVVMTASELPDAAQCEDANFASAYASKDKCYLAQQRFVIVDSLNGVGQVGQRIQKKKWFLGGTKGITDPNPGAFHVVMSNQLGLMKHAFAANIDRNLRDGQVWNQPVVGFSTQVVSSRRKDDGSGTVDVETKLSYVSEISQRWNPVVGTSEQKIVDVVYDYTLELDAGGNITGGEWAKRASHPSFIWKHDKLDFKGYMGKLNEIYKPRF